MKTSVIRYSELKEHDDWRWDSEYVCFYPRQNKALTYKRIGEILSFAQYGISIDMNEEGNGCKIYRMNEISTMFCDRGINKHATISKAQIAKFKLRNNDVLFNRTNSQEFVGRTGIFKKFSDEDIVFASYLIRVRTNEDEVLPEYLTAFLNTKYGVQDAKRRARISINQSNINAEELKRVKIPIISKNIQENIRKIFALSFELVNKSESLYSQAEQILLSELDLLNWKPKYRLSFFKNFSDTKSGGRIDAEYFQPMYDEIVEKYKAKTQCLSLKKVTTLVGHPSNPPYAGGDSKDKTFVITQKYLGAYYPSDNFWEDSEALYTTKEFTKKNKQFLLQKNDIILYSVGAYIGKANIYNSDIQATIGSFLTLIRPDQTKINPYYLLVFLNSDFGKQLTRRCSRGMAQQYVYPFDIKEFAVPIIHATEQKGIEVKMLGALNAKNLSKRLLDIAKRGVELAIEKNENDALGWIDAELKKLNITV